MIINNNNIKKKNKNSSPVNKNNNKYLINQTDINMTLGDKNKRNIKEEKNFNKSPNLEIKKNCVIYDNLDMNKNYNNINAIYYNKKRRGGFSKTKNKIPINNGSLNNDNNNNINNNNNDVNSLRNKNEYCINNYAMKKNGNTALKNNEKEELNIKENSISIDKIIQDIKKETSSNEDKRNNKVISNNINKKIKNNSYIIIKEKNDIENININKNSNSFKYLKHNEIDNDDTNNNNDKSQTNDIQDINGNKINNNINNIENNNTKENIGDYLIEKNEEKNFNDNNNKDIRYDNIINKNNNNLNNINDKSNNKDKKIENKNYSDKDLNNNNVKCNLENKFNNLKINSKIKLSSDAVQNLIKNIRNRGILKNNELKKNLNNNNKNINEIKGDNDNMNNIDVNNINNINNINENGNNLNVGINDNIDFDKIISSEEELSNKVNINININNNNIEKTGINLLNSNNERNLIKNNYLTSYINKKDSNTNRNNNLNQNITDKETNKNFSKIPVAIKAISNKISKLNLDIFTTQNKEENNNNKNQKIKSSITKKSSTDCIVRRNGTQENQIRIFNGIENDNIINGISTENLITSNDNMSKINNEEMHSINNNNINYRRLNTDLFNSKNNSNRNEINDKCQLLRSNKNLSSNTNREQKKSYLSNTIESKNAINKGKKLKNQYPLFFNTHDYSINNDNLEYSNNKTKIKKTNKLLIKNFSNSKKHEKKKQKDILNTNPKYLDISYFNKYNTSLLKSNNNNNCSTSVNDEKFFRGLKPPVPSNNIRKKSQEYNKMMNEINESYNKNIKNNTKKQYYNSLKYIQNSKDGNSCVINENTDNTHNSKNLEVFNNFEENNNENYYNNFFDDKSNDELKKLLEKNLENYSPNYKKDIDFTQGIMESFCYFKILDKDSPKFNPLDSCAVNPEALGYCEGYISIDVILGHLKIIPKRTATDNFKSNNNFVNNIMYQSNNSSMSENKLFNNLNNNGKNNNIMNNFYFDDNNVCLRIELKEINGIKIKKHMQDIMKIHKIFLKYNSHSGMEYEDNNGRIKKRVLSINKLIYMKEITEINMDQNEKIKAALCNFFAFTLIFGNNKVNKVECIFINFEQFNIWNKCLETIAENNNKSKNTLISSRGLFHRKYNSNCPHNYSNRNNNDNGME